MAETQELEIRFAECDAARAAEVKRQVLARLAELGVTNFAEGVVDGVDLRIESDDATPDFDDDATPILVFDEDRSKLRALEADLARRFGAALTFRQAVLPDQAWKDAWDQTTEPIRTRRFFVWPQDLAVKPPRGPVVLRLVRGEAFGNGRHATTQAALEALENLPETLQRGAALDVGTGTGILLLAAHHLGFGPLEGTDIDDAVLAEAGRNARLNGVTMRLENTPEPRAGKRYPLILANILVPVLHHLMPHLASLLADEGRLVLAGFIDKEAAPLIAAAERVGLVEESRSLCRGWVGLVLRKRGG